jgi:hypothetical protein
MEYREGLPERPERMRRLPLDERGYPVPYFVGYVDGKPDFRTMDAKKLAHAVRLKLCWLCGQPLGRFRTFPVGPMCAINRGTAEPPSHLECARYGVRACPFLVRPHARRREANLPEDTTSAGIMIKRNPGVTCLWTATADYAVRRAGAGVLFVLPDPTAIEWWTEGREATDVEVWESFETGVELLTETTLQHDGAGALDELAGYVRRAIDLLPARPEKMPAG